VTVAWYAAYGSNTDEERFRRYLAGCTAPCEPSDSRPYVLDRALYFAGESTGWGEGGVAFVRATAAPEVTTLARAWLLPVERIAEVGAQENRRPATEGSLDLDAVLGRGIVPTFRGWYDAWVACGELDGVPVITLTSSTDRAPERPPAASYVHVVARGLRTTHGMTRESVADYLAPRTNLSIATLIECQLGGSG